MNITKIYSDEKGQIVASRNNNNKEHYLKKNGNYYKIDNNTLNESINIFDLKYRYNIKDSLVYVFFEVAIIILALVIYFRRNNYVVIDSNIVIAMLILVLNVVFHELGHIIFLRIAYRDHKPKFGFKMIFIYPAFYVDTSDSYLIPKYKRLAIYLAGNFMNAVYVLFIGVFFPKFSHYNYLVVSTILINFIPIIKTDGYYFFLGLFNKVNKEKNKKAEFIEDFVRGLCMFVFLYFLDKVL